MASVANEPEPEPEFKPKGQPGQGIVAIVIYEYEVCPVTGLMLNFTKYPGRQLRITKWN